MDLELLVVTRGKTFSVALPEGAAVWIGRAKEVEVRLDDERVAARHLCVRARGELAEVSVEPGASGVQINDVQFSGAAKLRVGDQLDVGGAAIILQSGALALP